MSFGLEERESIGIVLDQCEVFGVGARTPHPARPLIRTERSDDSNQDPTRPPDSSDGPVRRGGPHSAGAATRRVGRGRETPCAMLKAMDEVFGRFDLAQRA